jgi:hypothetical protein
MEAGAPRKARPAAMAEETAGWVMEEGFWVAFVRQRKQMLR